MEHKAPANISAAKVAIIHFFTSFTSTTSNSNFELQSCMATPLNAFEAAWPVPNLTAAAGEH